MSAAPLEARELRKTYGELVAVDDVTLTVSPGDVYGYLGPNGAGKTTSLRMMLGLIRPTGGEVRLFGQDPIDDPVAALAGVAGFVEEPAFYPYLSGRRNLEMLATLDGGDGSRIDELLRLVDLHHRAGDRVRGYSHGMRQRLGLAGALLRGPRLLLLDEPTTGLDPAGMRDMRELVRRLAADGITILLSTHLMSEVEQLCNRLAIIQLGRIRYEGALADLLARSDGRYRLDATDAPRAAGHLPGDRRDPRRHRGRRVRAVRGRAGRRRHGVAAPGRGGDRRAGARAGREEPRGALLRDHRGRGAMTGRAYAWEVRKLAAQRRTYLGLGAAVVAPIVLVVAIEVHPPQPTDPGSPFFLRYAVESGLAVPLLMLLFASVWLFPLVAALVAGDIVAAEDGNRTLKTILTRSAGRSAIFAAKVGAAFTYVLAALLVMVATSILAGGIASGFDPLPTFSTVVSPSRALLLIAGSFAVYSLPALAIAAIAVLLSTVSRNSAGAVVGTLLAALLMQLTQIIPVLDSDAAQRWMLTAQLQAWQALFRTPLDWGPVVHAAYISIVYAVPALIVAWVHFLRRDVAG